MKRALVFGATGGIGQSICSDLARHGWSLYLHYYRAQEKAEKMVHVLMRQYPNQDFIPVTFDFLASKDKLCQFVASILPVNALIFSQGITKYDLLSKQSLSDIERVIKIDLTTPIELTKQFEAILTKQEFSRIVYLGSVYGGQGSALETVYSSAKAGLTRFCQAYAREVASMNLTVNVIAPGAVATPMNSMLNAETKNEVRSEIPLGRWANGKDISFWVSTLLDPSSSYCTGQTIYVSGGWLL